MTIRNPTSLALLAFAAVSVVTVGIAGGSATWHALGHYPEMRLQQSGIPITAQAEVDLAPIHALAPFGIAAAAEGPLQATSSNLVLRGVILARPASKSTALVADAGGPAIPVSIGEALPGGAILDSVGNDHVVLLLAGRKEILSFPVSQSSAGVAAIRAGIPSAFTDKSAVSAGSPQETIDAYRRKIADNPKSVLDEFSVAATPEGYKVSDLIAPGVRRAGLQPGDLIVRVNGVAVGDVEKDRRLFDDVAASGRARVEVLRAGQLLILSFPLR